MATGKSAPTKDVVFEWEGKDRNGKQVRGETRAVGENQVKSMLRRQGVTPTKIKKRRMRSGKSIKPKDMAIFTRLFRCRPQFDSELNGIVLPTADLDLPNPRADLYRSRGMPIVLISHNMPHVFEVADRIHVHRLGKRLCVINPKDYTMSDAVAFMTGARAAPDADIAA